MQDEPKVQQNDFDEDIDDELESEEIEELSVVEKIMGVFISPVSTFRQIAKKPDFWTPLIVLSLIGIATTFLSMPIMLQGSDLALSEQMGQIAGMPGEEQSMAMIQNVMRITMYISAVLGPPINFTLQWLIGCGIIFFIGLFMGLDTDYKRLLGVVPWSFFMMTVGTIINSIMHIGAEVTSASQMRDPAFLKPFSIAPYIPENLPFWMKAVGAMIDPFSIWTAIAIVFAIEAANKCKRDQAIVITIIFIILAVAIQAGTAQLGVIFQPK